MKQKIMNSTILTNESGRSMVEMLGVLAIVGVLSVGGVYGYGVAMKKHKANELLHQASMLATTISAQIQSKGELPQSIEDFGNGKYGTFRTPTKANDEQFTMQITGMDEAVCAQVAKMSGGMVRKAECNTTTLILTYNNNLSSEPVSADYNGNKEGCENSGRKYCSGSNSCVALDKECPCPKSAQVKILNCDGTLTDCCSTTQTCENPVCTCVDDVDCPGVLQCFDGKCLCPQDMSTGFEHGYLGIDGQTCCTDTGTYEGSISYYGLRTASACGCPENTEMSADGKACCLGGLDYSSGWKELDFSCGCPEDGQMKGTTCCKDGFEYVIEGAHPGYNKENIPVCGCPKNGEIKNNVCCLEGHVWDGFKYYGWENYKPNICGCPCPEEAMYDGNTCAIDGRYFDAGNWFENVELTCSFYTY